MAYDFLAQRFAQQRQPQLAQPFDLGAALGYGPSPTPMAAPPPSPAPAMAPPVAPLVDEEQQAASKPISGGPAADEDKWSVGKGLGSAAKGASIGATAGSIVPGVGTAVGGIVGGLGGFLGSLF